MDVLKNYIAVIIVLFLVGCQSIETGSGDSNLVENKQMLAKYYDELGQENISVSSEGFVLCNDSAIDKIAKKISRGNISKDERLTKVYFLLTNVAGNCRIASRLLPDAIKTGDSSEIDNVIDNIRDAEDELADARGILKKLGGY